MSYIPIPPWELSKANIDDNYTELLKEENPHALASLTRSHITDKYSKHLNISTDGSVLANGEAGGGFVIPDLKIRKSYDVGFGYSIFSAERVALLMAFIHVFN